MAPICSEGNVENSKDRMIASTALLFQAVVGHRPGPRACGRGPGGHTGRAKRGLAGVAMAALISTAAAQAERPRAVVSDLTARLEQVQADPKALQSALKTGSRLSAAVCANCHGERGVSAQPEVPNLAGQNAAYLAEQLRQFAEGQRRNEFMEGMIKAMGADERIGIVLHYASMTMPPRPAMDPALAARGREQYARNCFRCHGNDGHGNAQMARLAGQQGRYVVSTIKRYRVDKGPRVNPLMADATRLLSDEDIEALAAYIGSMP